MPPGSGPSLGVLDGYGDSRLCMPRMHEVSVKLRGNSSTLLATRFTLFLLKGVMDRNWFSGMGTHIRAPRWLSAERCRRDCRGWICGS